MEKSDLCQRLFCSRSRCNSQRRSHWRNSKL